MKRFWKAASRMARAWFRASGKNALARTGSSSGIREQWNRLTALLRMLRAWAGGRYKNVPLTTLLFSLLALVYFLSPIDLISDFIPVVGLLDDVTVVLLLLSAIRKDLDHFRAWEDAQRHTIDAEHPASAVS
jgi:uncharacterized membrane protein YkvA (DUF1232 family)